MKLFSQIIASLALLCLLVNVCHAFESTCSGKVQDSLLYGMSDFTAVDVGLPNAEEGVSLTEAICCDQQYRKYAEPNGLYKFYGVGLFRTIDTSGVTTFYDSVCGLPVFRAPVGRSFEAWKAETDKHGWPSFRAAEVLSENIIVDTTTYNGAEHLKIYSKCGTYLGDNLIDDVGDRYCIDLSCISGQPTEAAEVAEW